MGSWQCVRRASVNPAVFIYISLAIARVSAKEQQELAMCWRWGRVSRTYGSAIVIDTRTKGSKGFGHGSNSSFHFLFHYPFMTLISPLYNYSSFHFLFHYPLITPYCITPIKPFEGTPPQAPMAVCRPRRCLQDAYPQSRSELPDLLNCAAPRNQGLS